MDSQQANDYFFESFEHTAFRLETRDVYFVDREQERFKKFLAGAVEDDSPYTEYKLRVRQLTSRGIRVERVR
ncbi:MAG: DUF6879 family protein, partial [Gammaproteobacteria bacterium]